MTDTYHSSPSAVSARSLRSSRFDLCTSSTGEVPLSLSTPERTPAQVSWYLSCHHPSSSRSPSRLGPTTRTSLPSPSEPFLVGRLTLPSDVSLPSPGPERTSDEINPLPPSPRPLSRPFRMFITCPWSDRVSGCARHPPFSLALQSHRGHSGHTSTTTRTHTTESYSRLIHDRLMCLLPSFTHSDHSDDVV